LYKNNIDNTHQYQLVSDERDLQLASKRSNNILDTNKLEKWCSDHNIQLSNIQDVIKQCFDNYKKET
jgi:hypothetical protein